jgi:hypothetical protein
MFLLEGKDRLDLTHCRPIRNLGGRLVLIVNPPTIGRYWSPAPFLLPWALIHHDFIGPPYKNNEN